MVRDRLPAWLLGAALGLLGGGLLAMDAVAHAEAASLVIEVAADRGAPLVQVSIAAMDGAVVARGAAGTPLSVAPGTYTVTLHRRGIGVVRTLRAIRLGPRERARRLVRL